jgi:hypothetical protein
VKDEEDGKCDTTESRGVVPLYFLAEIEDREDVEDRESDDFLNGLQLRGAEFIRANAIRKNLEAVFEKSDTPAHQDHFPKSGSAELEVAVPGKVMKIFEMVRRTMVLMFFRSLLVVKYVLRETRQSVPMVQTGRSG